MPGTCSSGISTPRSPRATISASVRSRMSASRVTACGFSILAITVARPRVIFCASAMSSGRWIGVELEGGAVGQGDGARREGADPKLRSLQIDQDADRPPVLEFDRADCRHELAHAVVRSMAHVDAEDVGAGPKQAGDDGAVGGGRTEGGDDLGPAQASHQRMIPK